MKKTFFAGFPNSKTFGLNVKFLVVKKNYLKITVLKLDYYYYYYYWNDYDDYYC